MSKQIAANNESQYNLSKYQLANGTLSTWTVLGSPPWHPQVGTYDAVLMFIDKATKMLPPYNTQNSAHSTST